MQGRLTFPEGEAPLHPGSHTPHKRHLATTAQGHSLPSLHPLIINVGPIAAVVLQNGLQGCAAVAGRFEADGAVQTTDACVRHLHKAHLGQMIATPAGTGYVLRTTSGYARSYTYARMRT